ncbi:MAG: cobyrinate a,c-diamide synthase, partial [Candidatus Subteraquimicrobiales bacterium]|nr:cobyrinate a,c-diamide synthase [Candidatus Subteraquimicrobiales bacterium]
MKACMIAGDRSGSGKTSITLAVASLLSRRFAVQTFKVGMDYIDTSYHTAVAGRPCRNLDSFVLSDSENREIFAHGCAGADIAIIEGVRGLFEGAEALDDTGSSASIAKLLGVPVILVVDARSITRSAAALVNGFVSFDPSVRIAGVILNNVTGEQHKRKVRTAIETFCRIPVLGTIPRFSRETLTMRHLGLVPYLEGKKDRSFQEMVSSLAEEIAGYIDLDALLDCAADLLVPQEEGIFRVLEDDLSVTIGIARDEAFNFYYADLFDMLPVL